MKKGTETDQRKSAISRKSVPNNNIPQKGMAVNTGMRVDGKKMRATKNGYSGRRYSIKEGMREDECCEKMKKAYKY